MPLVSFRLSLARVLMVTTVVLGTHASAQTTRVPASGAIPALNAVAGALQKAGVRRCVDKIQKVTDFLTKGARVGTTVFPMATNPDDSLISISSEIVSGQVLTYASANFAPRADGCSAEYEQVSHWQNTCEQVRASQFANFKPMGQLQQAIKVYYNQAVSQVMLVPAGAGCVVIKKEIVH